MNAQHTPGPWKVFRVKNGENKGKIIGIGDADAGGVTDPFGGLWRSGKELEANAELIAAAPVLLDELREARTTLSIVRTQIMVEIAGGRERWEGVPEAIQLRIGAIDAAIAKATGAA